MCKIPVVLVDSNRPTLFVKKVLLWIVKEVVRKGESTMV